MTLAITLFRLLFASLFIDRLFAQNPAWTASPFSAPALPLAVRSPYLNTWLGQGGNALPLHAFWAKLWRMDIDTGWYSLVMVDGVAYRIMGEVGVPNISPATQTSTEFTATRTSFLFMAGPMRINASFISPIEPTDLVRQSLPYSYFTMSASSTDGKSHSVRMYSDIAGQFVGPSTQLAQWNANTTGDYIILSMQLVTPQRYTESSDVAMDSTAYYGFKAISGATTSWAISNDTLNRSNAANASFTLGNMTQPAPRSIQDKLGNWTTLGISIDWGEVESTPQPAVWSLGVVRSPSIQYAVPPSMQDRYPYFIATYPDPQQATAAFLNDFPRAQSVAAQFDARISSAGGTISQNYADLLALSARQIMGSLDITISKAADGSWKMWDLMVFMKNMGGFGSDATGSVSSVNAVDTLYAAFPAFMYLNPDLGGHLLTPLMEYQDSSVYTLSYAARNIGSTYPNATADNINSPHTYGIEESAGMLIMTLAYTQWSGNNTLISKHYGLLRGWAEYLGNNTLTPTAQSSADSVLGQALSSTNQTNLALKGIIGIACMAKIAAIAGSNDDQSRFDATASSYITQWQKISLPSDGSHIDFFYGNSDSSGLIYNLYADRLLQLNLVPQEVYQAVTSLYNTAGGSIKYGLPLNNKQADRTTTHWMMFAASTATDTTGTFMVSQIHNYASSQQNNTPFAVSYNPSLGNGVSEPNSGKNSPACGAMFSFLVINGTSFSSSGPSSSASSQSSKSTVGKIVGGTIGGIAAVILIVVGGCLFRKHQQRQSRTMRDDSSVIPWYSPASVIFPEPSNVTRTDRYYRERYASAYSGSALSGSGTGSGGEKVSQVGSTDWMLSSERSQSYATTAGRSVRIRALLDATSGDRERLRADVDDIRRDLDRLRANLSPTLPSYSDAGIIE